MFEIGWAELLVIGVVALIVIGPEDLPQLFRQIGRFTGKLRQMGREFQRAMDQAAKETGVKDVATDLGKITSPKAMGLDAVKAAADKFEKWDPIKNAAKPTAVAKAATAGEAAADAAEAALTTRTAAATASLGAASATASEPATVPQAKMGPETQALYDKQKARQAVLEESAAKLKAIETGKGAATAPKVARSPRTTKPKAATEPGTEPGASAPRATVRSRKTASTDDASAAAPARTTRKTSTKKKDAEA